MTGPQPRVPSGAPTWNRRTLAEHIDHRANGLNLVRLVLASSVIFWHSFPLTGRDFPFAFGRQFLGQFAVDGFFVISGFLLVGSWLHRPAVLNYVKNRLLRIVPAFWVCLIVTAFVVAPVAVLVQHGQLSTLFDGPRSSPLYVLKNMAIQVRFYDIAGTPADVPFPGVWNGSLWTLRWEFFAYFALLGLGLLRLLDRRAVVLVIWAGLWAVNIALTAGLVDDSYYVKNGARLGFMFACGMVAHLYGRNLPASRWAPMVAAAVLPLSWLLPDYRVVGAPALAYLVLWIGGAVRRPLLQLKDRDISYGVYIYAFPLQQLLVVLGWGALPVWVFGGVSLLLTVPVAAASWVWIERPILRLKKRGPGRSASTAVPPAGGDVPTAPVSDRV